MARWWEKETIKFECQEGCLKCCVKPGVIYFDEKDIQAVTEFLGCTKKKFIKEFLKKQGNIWELEVEDEKPCPFLNFNGCAIHPAKPKQCQTYPFWKENLETRNHWKLTAAFCPGINEGPRIEAKNIAKQLRDFTID